MSMDDGENLAHFADRIQELRRELKEWEKAFESANNGRKAEREDIRQNPTIARKYKQYNRLRGHELSAAPTNHSSSTGRAKRRRLSRTEDVRTSKSAPSSHPAQIDPYDPPIHLTPIRLRTSIGPTPQKNGQVLGLFDLLSPPSMRHTPPKLPGTLDSLPEGQATPSKKRAMESIMAITATPSKRLLTPKSSSVRKYMDKFTTPTAIRFNGKLTPSSRKGRKDDTPDFLRRESQQIFHHIISSFDKSTGEQAEVRTFSPLPARVQSIPAGKGLSALVKGLKNMEEERLDEELDIIHELEAEEHGQIQDFMSHKLRIQVEDSQLVLSADVPLGADGEIVSSEDEEAKEVGIGLDGRPLKTWKKRGQKRTTRKANIKPSIAKWKPEPIWEAGKGKDDSAMVVELSDTSRQFLGEGMAQDAGNEILVPVPERTNRDGPIGNSKKPYKAGAAAHPNFRALKLRNKATKGKKGGRFGRRG